jgi:hypothetical protein
MQRKKNALVLVVLGTSTMLQVLCFNLIQLFWQHFNVKGILIFISKIIRKMKLNIREEHTNSIRGLSKDGTGTS